MPDLTCFHAEADTAMFTIYNQLRSSGYTSAVVLDTEDTDNYVQAAFVAQNTTGLVCLKRKGKLISARCLCDEAMAASIIPLHVLTGCDHNSAFYAAGKKAVTDRLQKSQEAHNLLSKCGTQLPVTDEILSDLERFVIKYIYADAKHKTLAEARAAKWQAMKRKKIIRLVPESDSLRHHLERANYLTYIQKHYQLQTQPSPLGHGWHIVNGLCLPVRHTQPSLPPSITPRIMELEDQSSDESGGDDSDSDSCGSYQSSGTDDMDN